MDLPTMAHARPHSTSRNGALAVRVAACGVRGGGGGTWLDYHDLRSGLPSTTACTEYSLTGVKRWRILHIHLSKTYVRSQI